MIQLNNIIVYMNEEADLAALKRGITVAKAYNAKITLMSVLESYDSYTLLSSPNININAIERQLVKSRNEQLIKTVESIDHEGVTISIEVIVGDPAISIIRFVQSQNIDLLIKAPEPKDGPRQKHLGSIDMRLMRYCPCPVSIEPQKETEHTNRAIVALDYDADDEWLFRLNSSILNLALLAISGTHPDLYIVHAWSLYGYSYLADGLGRIPSDELKEMVAKERSERQNWLKNRMEIFRETLGKEQAIKFDPKTEVIEGKPETVIPQRVDEIDADLLCMGTASRSGLKGLLLGNTAEEILHRINCSVVVIKPADFVCPISP
ncbi:MAG: universal stress protein [Desulfobacterales bacterium]|nr:universal stress protein [Desulfobacterales bacterium]